MIHETLSSHPIKNITLFDQYSFLGGGQMVLLSIVEAACRVARKVVLVVPMGGALELAIRERFGSRVEIVNTPELQITHGSKGLQDMVKLVAHSFGMVIRHWRLVRNADLIHVNGARQFLGIILLSLLTGKFCYYHVHVNHSKAEKLLIWLAAQVSTTRFVIVNSPFVLGQLIRRIKSLSDKSNIILVENSLGDIYEGKSFIDRYKKTDNDILNVVVLGTMRPEKGQDIALELARRNKYIHLHLVGRVGEGAEEWIDKLKYNAPHNVTFYEAVSNVPSFFDQIRAHVNLVPSRWEEPFGLVAIEGMANSCLTIVSNCGGLADIAANTSAICCNDFNEISMAIERVLTYTPIERAELAKIQFEATMSLYRPERFVESMCKLFTYHES